MSGRALLLSLALIVAAQLAPSPALAQRGELCSSIREQLLFFDSPEQMQQKRALSGDYLFGSSGTIGCLVEMLREPGIATTSSEIDLIQGEWLLRITGAMRSILTTRGWSAIKDFRAVDDPSTTAVLAFAARSADAGLRVNATLVLADVIDDSTACVPIDHLYDTSQISTPQGASGRINLIGVVSVVAPWAYRPTFENIERLVAKLDADLADQQDVKQTMEVLANLKARLDFQKKSQKAPNRLSELPFNQRDCMTYEPLWAGAELRY
ncbi:MAG: hypothetical protein Q8Q62_07040 [Mesorhizobium sp.]|nr:hypothetical protein [Mesorhizobium sp.]